MVDYAQLGLSGLAKASQSFAAMQKEKQIQKPSAVGTALRLGLAGASLGKTIGKDLAIRKGLPETSKYTAKEAKHSQFIGAGDTEEVAAEQVVKAEPSQETYEKWSTGAGTLVGIMSGLF